MNILIGVTGGIAAYKVAILVRLFVKNGHNVKVIMSPMAKHFVAPLTLATLSKNPILVDFYNPENGEWNSHVDIGMWANAYVIAPATANSIAKMAGGIADNLLLTTYLSARCPVFFAPTMDLDMFKHTATQKNINILEKRGNIKIDADTGELASGLEGKGRMAEPEVIYQNVINYFNNNELSGKTALVTAGPTYEHIDPVRFIGNYSSGKMGYAIAEELAERGAKVFLISGPTKLTIKNPNIKKIDVISAQEMFEKSDTLTIKLTKTPDIAQNIGFLKKKNQIVIGFALETNNELENAKKKLKNKNFDFIVLNSLKDKGAGFNVNTNKITIIKKDFSVKNFELKNKTEVAKDIVNEISKL